ncbi:MAG: hypothetical protein ACTIJ9_01415 [Aequorivita sp.]
MKTLKISVVIFTILGMISCKDGERKDAPSVDYANENLEDNLENRGNIDSNTQTDSLTSNDNDYYEVSTENLDDLYAELDMTQDQIDRFEQSYIGKIEVKKSSDHGTMDPEKLQKQKEESLKEVLSAEQFDKYDQWKGTSVHE